MERSAHDLAHLAHPALAGDEVEGPEPFEPHGAALEAARLDRRREDEASRRLGDEVGLRRDVEEVIGRPSGVEDPCNRCRHRVHPQQGSRTGSARSIAPTAAGRVSAIAKFARVHM
jgi:hypothetical protein